MGTLRLFVLSLVAVAMTAPVSRADTTLLPPTADTWPLPVNERPLTLASGMLELRGDTFRASLSEDAVGEPISLAPDVYVGIDRHLTVGFTHRVGVCLTPGEESGCPTAYHDAGAEVVYSFMRGGNVQMAFSGGIDAPRFSPFTAGVHAGSVTRIRGGKIAFVLEPNLYLGLLGRSNDTEDLTVPTREVLRVPVSLQFQAQPQTNIFATSGLRESLRDFGDSYEIPLGVGATFALNHRLDLGGEFRLDDLFGRDGGFARRILILRAALRV